MKKYLATLGAAALMTLTGTKDVQAQSKNNFRMYDIGLTESNNTHQNNFNSKYRANLEAGVYVTKPNDFVGELSVQGNLGKNTWLGPYAKFRSGKIQDNTTETDTRRKQLTDKLYTESIRNEKTLNELKQNLELGIKLSKGFGNFEAGVGFGYAKTDKTTTKSIFGNDKTMKLVDHEYKTLETKPFTIEGEASKSSSWSPIVSAETKWYPANNFSIGIQGQYDLKEKKAGVFAKIGWTFGGKK